MGDVRRAQQGHPRPDGRDQPRDHVHGDGRHRRRPRPATRSRRRDRRQRPDGDDPLPQGPRLPRPDHLRTRAKIAAGLGCLNKLLPDDDVANSSRVHPEALQRRRWPSRSRAPRSTPSRSRRARASTSPRPSSSPPRMPLPRGGEFSNGDTAPAVVDPVPYSAGLPDAFKFYEAELLIGGTTALTAGEIVVTGGIARCEIDNVELEANFNLATDAYGLCLDDRRCRTCRGPARAHHPLRPQLRDGRGRVLQRLAGGTPAVVESCTSSAPSSRPGRPTSSSGPCPTSSTSGAPLPSSTPSTGSSARPSRAGAYVDPTLGVDWGLTWKTLDDLTL